MHVHEEKSALGGDKGGGEAALGAQNILYARGPCVPLQLETVHRKLRHVHKPIRKPERVAAGLLRVVPFTQGQGLDEKIDLVTRSRGLLTDKRAGSHRQVLEHVDSHKLLVGR